MSLVSKTNMSTNFIIRLIVRYIGRNKIRTYVNLYSKQVPSTTRPFVLLFMDMFLLLALYLVCLFYVLYIINNSFLHINLLDTLLSLSNTDMYFIIDSKTLICDLSLCTVSPIVIQLFFFDINLLINSYQMRISVFIFILCILILLFFSIRFFIKPLLFENEYVTILKIKCIFLAVFICTIYIYCTDELHRFLSTLVTFSSSSIVFTSHITASFLYYFLCIYISYFLYILYISKVPMFRTLLFTVAYLYFSFFFSEAMSHFFVFLLVGIEVILFLV